MWLRKGGAAWLLLPAAASLALFVWLLSLQPAHQRQGIRRLWRSLCGNRSGLVASGRRREAICLCLHKAFFSGNEENLPSESPELFALLRASAACNDAELTLIDDRPVIVGDSTEGALLVAAPKGGITRATI